MGGGHGTRVRVHLFCADVASIAQPHIIQQRQTPVDGLPNRTLALTVDFCKDACIGGMRVHRCPEIKNLP